MLPSNFKKKGILALVAGIASLGVLAACSDIEAKPNDTDYNAAIVKDSDKETTNNTIDEIYDALVNAGDSNSAKVLNNILYIYSKAVYGDFWEIHDAIEANDTAALQNIAKEHSAYGGDVDKITIFYDEMVYRIKTTFLGYVKDSSYQVRSFFREKKFYDAQIKNYYNLVSKEGDNAPYNEGEKLVEGGFRLSEGHEENGTLILDGEKTTTGDASNAYFKNIFGTYKNYIEINLLPDLYRSQLTAQYLYLENYGQIKLTAARKVETLKLSDNERYPNAVRDLVKAYCHNVIGTADAGLSLESTYDFRFLDNINEGTMDGFSTEEKAMANTILTEAGWTKVGTGDDAYYQESAYGTLMAQYEKIVDKDRFNDDSSIRSDFTNSGAYTVETGLEIKKNNLKTKDSTSYGWYTSGQLDGSLPSALSKRLFKVQVANEVDHKNDTSVTFKYGHYVGNDYYLYPETYEDDTNYPYAVYESGSWYICKVEEAVKASKISGGSEGYNTLTGNSLAEEKVARKIGYMLSSNDTWKTAAQKYYVNEMATSFSDSYVYTYFKNTFPDLFSDD